MNDQLSQSLVSIPATMAHEIIMLGTGNAFLPNGRHHSFAIFDKKHIIDAPPTALLSLRENGIKVDDIETIFITHLHGDHVFGLPFLLLERTYISDREFQKCLTIVAAPGARKKIEHLCEIAYPGSLENILSKITWNENSQGVTTDGWSWNRFEVNHNDAVDPFGYSFESSSGAKFVHSGDSGPCEPLYDAISKTDLAIIEMGIPEWVPSDEHHKPSDIQALSEQYPNTNFIITHTFIDCKNSQHPTITSNEFPNHPSNVLHAQDKYVINWNGKWFF
ncbi:MAG TPA: MBL fold metallo-hydrolase [Candidatus Poseidoniales archaeon]|jgi:ribonuclease BN (tRNA processing enzyme)|nr:MAG TPA: MBL fold metallo-hydrolase [Candidatus Poseidoniales archaeon]